MVQGSTYVSPWGDDKTGTQSFGSGDSGRNSKMKWILILVLAAVLILGGFAVYSLISDQEGPKIILEFSDISQVLAGEPFSVDVAFSNDSDKVLKNAKLALSLPEGVAFLGQGSDQRVGEELVGDVGPGSLNRETFDLIATGGGQEIKRLEVKLVYSVAPNEKVTFETKTETDVSVGRSVVDLEIEAPSNVFSGENFEIKVKYQNNSRGDLKGVKLRLNYPPIFQFSESSIKSDSGNNIWEIGTLGRGDKAEITVRGSVIGQERSFFSFGALMEERLSGQDYVINEQSANVGVSLAPLSLTIFLNGSDDYIARAGDNLKYVLKYKNNSDFSIENVSLKARVMGEILELVTARTEGVFNSLANTFSWSVADDPRLASVAPGEEGSVSFDIKLKSTFPIKRLSDKNYLVKVTAEAESPTVPSGITASKTVSIASLETKVSGRLDLDARGYYRDAPSGILNTGPFPMRVNQPTQLTVHWVLTNYATDVSGVSVSAFLLSGARWTGAVKSGVSAVPIYNSASNEVTWKVDKIPATKGVISQPVEAIFQVEVTPAVNQIGKTLEFLSDSKIQAQDSFTGVTLSDVDENLDTNLPDDTTLSGIDKKVQP